jgi:hypothetical protein
LIWGERKQESFCEQIWTGQITLKPLQKIAPPRRSTARPSGRHSAARWLVWRGQVSLRLSGQVIEKYKVGRPDIVAQTPQDI